MPWPSGALTPAAAAEAARALATACADANPDHPSVARLARAARAATVAAHAAANVTRFLEAAAERDSGAGAGEPGAEPGDEIGDEIGDVGSDASSDASLRAMFAAGLAAETIHGDARLARLANYARPPSGLGGLIEDGTLASRGVEGDAASPLAAALSLAGAGDGGGDVSHLKNDTWRSMTFEGVVRNARDVDSRAVASVVPMLDPRDAAALAARAISTRGASAAEEIRVAALLSLAHAARENGDGDGDGETSRDDSIPDVSDVDAQDALEEALREGVRSGTVRAEWAASACAGWKNPRAEGVVFVAVGAWLPATRSALTHFEETNRRDDTHAKLALERVLRERASRPDEVRERAAAVGLVADAWLRAGLPRDELERLLLSIVAGVERARDGGPPDDVGLDALLALVARDRAATRRAAAEKKSVPAANASVSPRTKLRFSAGFVLAVSTLRAASMEDARDAASSGNASASRLWFRIRGELAAPASLASSTSIRHDAPFAHPDDHESTNPANLPTPSPPIYRPAVDARVFSCGHAMSDERVEATATAFARGMTDAGLPMAGKLVAAEYALERCAMACPSCASRAVHARYGVKPETGDARSIRDGRERHLVGVAR